MIDKSVKLFRSNGVRLENLTKDFKEIKLKNGGNPHYLYIAEEVKGQLPTIPTNLECEGIEVTVARNAVTIFYYDKKKVKLEVSQLLKEVIIYMMENKIFNDLYYMRVELLDMLKKESKSMLDFLDNNITNKRLSLLNYSTSFFSLDKTEEEVYAIKYLLETANNLLDGQLDKDFMLLKCNSKYKEGSQDKITTKDSTLVLKKYQKYLTPELIVEMNNTTLRVVINKEGRIKFDFAKWNEGNKILSKTFVMKKDGNYRFSLMMFGKKFPDIIIPRIDNLYREEIEVEKTGKLKFKSVEKLINKTLLLSFLKRNKEDLLY